MPTLDPFAGIRFEDVHITRHAQQRLADRGFALEALRAALEQPEMVYAAKDDRYPNQYRLVRNGMVAVVDVARRIVPTVFFHGTTDYRDPHKGNGPRQARRKAA
jgi:hypothetical protein